jgi:NAD(P)-dependent dehydrogenase (short-subunit alcohol dehydrogenase family)
LFEHIAEDLGHPTLAVYAAQEGGRSNFLDTEPTALEHAWRTNCLGGFIVAREAASRMVQAGRGTIVLSEGTSHLE